MFYEIGFVGFKSFCLNASVRDLNVIICAISHKRNIFFEAPEAMGPGRANWPRTIAASAPR
jgi:hypothetical protein